MTQNEWSETRTGAEGFVRQEKRAADGLVDDAQAAATEAGSQARKLASEKADELQGAAASHLKSFADAVRTAGDELADKEPGPVSDLVRQAAEGLERFSGALGRKSSSEMIDSVRDFGRQNPVGFLAGSMLAGFALARFANSGALEPKTGKASSYERPAEADGDAAASSYGGEGQGNTAAESFDQTYGAAGGFASPDADLGSVEDETLSDIDSSGEERRRDAMLRETQI